MGVLLQACGHQKDVNIGREVHKIVQKSTQFRDDFVLNTRIITMYSMCGSPSESRSVFDQLKRKNLFQWNALISGYTRNELWFEAMSMFCELLVMMEFKPDNFTLPCVIKACGGILDVGLGQAVHGMAVKMGLIGDVFVGNALIALYGKCGFAEEAGKVFENMPERNLVSWNSILSGFSKIRFSRESFNVFREMLIGEDCMIPDDDTGDRIASICGGRRSGDGDDGSCFGCESGLSEELMVNNALRDMYSKCF